MLGCLFSFFPHFPQFFFLGKTSLANQGETKDLPPCWLAHTCLCAVTITNVSRHLCEEVTSLEVGWTLSLELSCMLLSLARGSFWLKCPLCTITWRRGSPIHLPASSNAKAWHWSTMWTDHRFVTISWSCALAHHSLTPTSLATCSTQSSSCRMTSYCGHPGLGHVMPINVDVTYGNDAGTANSLIAANYTDKAREHSEMFGFRAWVASVEPRFWYSVYCLEPNYSGRLPLYTIDFQDLRNCLATQPYITPELHDKHDWKDSVPPPPTYIMEVPSRVHPLASNFNEPERVHRRKMQHRDTTPRGHRSTPRDSTPQRRDFLSSQTPADHVPPRSITTIRPRDPSSVPPTDRLRELAPQQFPSCHFWPSDQFWPLGIYNQPQRIAAPLSDPVPTPSPSYAAMPPWTMHSHPQAQSSSGMPTQTVICLCPPSWAQDFAQPLSGLRPPFPPTLWPMFQIGSPRPFHHVIAETFIPLWRVAPRSSHLLLIGSFLLASWKTTSVPFRSSNQDPGSDVAMTDWGRVVPPKIPTFQPWWVRRTNSHHPIAYEHRRPRTFHLDQLLLHEDAEGIVFGLFPFYSECTDHHPGPAPRLAQICRRPSSTCTHPTRCCTTIQWQCSQCGPRHHQCQHSTLPT